VTTADDTAIVSALDRLDAANRAEALIGLAEHVDELPGPLTRRNVRLVADPALTAEQVRRYFADLVEAVQRRRGLEVGRIEPCDVDPDFGNKISDHDNAKDILCRKVDEAVAPLVGGAR
jgi:hypothetical protein